MIRILLIIPMLCTFADAATWAEKQFKKTTDNIADTAKKAVKDTENWEKDVEKHNPRDAAWVHARLNEASAGISKAAGNVQAEAGRAWKNIRKESDVSWARASKAWEKAKVDLKLKAEDEPAAPQRQPVDPIAATKAGKIIYADVADQIKQWERKAVEIPSIEQFVDSLKDSLADSGLGLEDVAYVTGEGRETLLHLFVQKAFVREYNYLTRLHALEFDRILNKDAQVEGLDTDPVFSLEYLVMVYLCRNTSLALAKDTAGQTAFEHLLAKQPPSINLITAFIDNDRTKTSIKQFAARLAEGPLVKVQTEN